MESDLLKAVEVSGNRIEESFVISTDKNMLQLEVIYEFLTHSHWAKGISKETVAKSIEHSMCFGVFERLSENQFKQVGFARVITDFTTFAYLSDVFILEEYRGLDLSKKLMGVIMKHPDLQGLRRWMLVTTYAHGLYEQFGFVTTKSPEKLMEIFVPNLYQKEAELLSIAQEIK
ncbi:MAG: GNAT family N-acetyltransferase [Chloroherpetonaceae bacterium]|nr:GNAT family N-acetyltransferase [Chloroherpetonaceae bacterium]